MSRHARESNRFLSPEVLGFWSTPPNTISLLTENTEKVEEEGQKPAAYCRDAVTGTCPSIVHVPVLTRNTVASVTRR